jgi:1-acyl-sn-glycerol-3-phosphate acyltransferase
VKDIVIRGGRNLYPQEVEEAVGAVPGIRKGCVAVFGLADARSGTEHLVVLAEAAPRRAGDAQALHDAVGHAVVEAIGEPADQIILAPPHTVLKTSSGKVRRSACRDLVEQGRVGAPAASPRRQWLRLAAGALALRLRSAWQAASEFLWSVRAVALFALFAPIGWLVTVTLPSADAAWAFCHRAARLLLRLAGAPVEVTGLEEFASGRPVVIVCNHASYLDGIVLVAALPRRHAFVAKRELASQFVAGRFLKRLGAAFVERFDPRRSVVDAQRMAEAATTGAPLLVFPEGTFVAAPGLLPFHLGAFLAAAQARVPVLPLTLTGTRRMLGAGRGWPKRAALAVQVGRPIEPPDDTALFAAAVQMRQAAEAAIARGLMADEH